MFSNRFFSAISFLILYALVFLVMPSSRAADNSTLDARRAELNKLLADQWEYNLRENPELATVIGDYRYNDRWSDNSLEHVQQQKRDMQQWLSRFEAVDVSGFPEQEKLNQQLMVRGLRERIQSIDLKTYEMPIDQFNGAHLQAAQFVALIPFTTTKQYEDYLARLHSLPKAFDEITEVLRQGEKDRLMPPRFLLEKTVEQCKSIASLAGEQSAFGQPVAKFPDSVPAADRKRLHDEIISAVENEVRPAYAKLGNFLAAEYAPKGRTEPGIWALPGGDALYRFDIRQLTTTNMDPEEIHQLGLKQVADKVAADETTTAGDHDNAHIDPFAKKL